MPEDTLPPTGEVTRDWCPKCEPEVDPLTTLVVVRWCAVHWEDPTGPDDAALQEQLAATPMRTCDVETDAATQRAWAEFFHRKKKRRRSQPRLDRRQAGA